MYHNFFIHSSASGHLGCFHVLASVNSASVNIGVDVPFSIMVYSGCMHSSGIARSYGSFPYGEKYDGDSLKFIVTVQIYIPTNSAKALPFFPTPFPVFIF